LRNILGELCTEIERTRLKLREFSKIAPYNK